MKLKSNSIYKNISLYLIKIIKTHKNVNTFNKTYFIILYSKLQYNTSEK